MPTRKFSRPDLAHLLHRHLLPLMVACYALAATYPAWGLRIKDARLVEVSIAGRPEAIRPTALMLAFLLFNAGLRIRGDRVRQIARRPGPLVAGVVANLAVPLAYLLLILPILRSWHNPDEAATALIGLTLVASMPIAGSSTGWAQAADGDMALSLGLVVISTLLSPFTTPFVLRTIGALTPGLGGSSSALPSGNDAGNFLTACVLLPSLLGIAARPILGAGRTAALDRMLKVPAQLTLLALCYVNASACLPMALGQPDWDFLAAILALVGGLCVTMFATGYALSRFLGTGREQGAALMFGLGMNNNGTGLVLASVAFASTPIVLLPIIASNLTQHLVAGCVEALLRRSRPGLAG